MLLPLRILITVFDKQSKEVLLDQGRHWIEEIIHWTEHGRTKYGPTEQVPTKHGLSYEYSSSKLPRGDWNEHLENRLVNISVSASMGLCLRKFISERAAK